MFSDIAKKLQITLNLCQESNYIHLMWVSQIHKLFNCHKPGESMHRNSPCSYTETAFLIQPLAVILQNDLTVGYRVPGHWHVNTVFIHSIFTVLYALPFPSQKFWKFRFSAWNLCATWVLIKLKKTKWDNQVLIYSYSSNVVSNTWLIFFNFFLSS